MLNFLKLSLTWTSIHNLLYQRLDLARITHVPSRRLSYTASGTHTTGWEPLGQGTVILVHMAVAVVWAAVVDHSGGDRGLRLLWIWFWALWSWFRVLWYLFRTLCLGFITPWSSFRMVWSCFRTLWSWVKAIPKVTLRAVIVIQGTAIVVQTAVVVIKSLWWWFTGRGSPSHKRRHHHHHRALTTPSELPPPCLASHHTSVAPVLLTYHSLHQV